MKRKSYKKNRQKPGKRVRRWLVVGHLTADAWQSLGFVHAVDETYAINLAVQQFPDEPREKMRAVRHE